MRVIMGQRLGIYAQMLKIVQILRYRRDETIGKPAATINAEPAKRLCPANRISTSIGYGRTFLVPRVWPTEKLKMLDPRQFGDESEIGVAHFTFTKKDVFKTPQLLQWS